MIAKRTVFIALLASVVPNALLADDKATPLIFSAMGCGPYNAADLKAAKLYVAQENQVQTSQFLIHLADICTGVASRDGTLTESSYSDIKDLFTNGNTIPSYIVPGDDEWNDRPDPDVGWELWRKYLLALEKNFKTGWETASPPSPSHSANSRRALKSPSSFYTPTVNKPWKDVRNTTRVQVDRLEPNFPPVQITVDTTVKKPFSFDRRLKKPDWKVPASSK